MRPSDLKPPFTKENKRLMIKDRIFFLPELVASEDFHFPGWSDPTIFAHKAPIKIEYCSGNGDWIAAKALENPNTNWVAIEMLFDRVRKIWSKRENNRLHNLFIVCGEAESCTTQFIPNALVSEVYINFPDPWPKRRHAKYRIVQPSFVKQLERILIPGGRINFVTDDPTYSEQFISMMQTFSSFQSCYPEPFFVTDYPEYGGSFFEDLWRSQGKCIRYHQFGKVL